VKVGGRNEGCVVGMRHGEMHFLLDRLDFTHATHNITYRRQHIEVQGNLCREKRKSSVERSESVSEFFGAQPRTFVS
jgi:hypothetical protein